MREFTSLLSKLREHLSSRDAGAPPDGALVASFRSFDLHGDICIYIYIYIHK